MCLYCNRGRREAPRTQGKRIMHNRKRRANSRKIIGAAFLAVLACICAFLATRKDKVDADDIDDSRVIVVTIEQYTTITTEKVSYTAPMSTTEESRVLPELIPDDTLAITVDDVITEDQKEAVDEPEPEQTPAPKQENTLYYVQDGRYRYDLPDEYQNYLWQQCKAYGIPEYYELLLAQMYHESSFKTNLISSTNDYGLMQINICNHRWLSGIIGDDDFLNPYTSIRAGVHMMSTFLHKYNDVQKALVCYNRGESAVRNGTYTTSYSRGVIDDMNLLVEK